MTNAGALLARPTPARPGPGPMAEGLLRALDVSIGRKVEGLLAGDFRSNLLGTGSELAMIRPYVAGDDVRRIDWNVTARTGEPHVRVDLAERVLVSWLVLDTSPSMQFGTADRRKADVAEGVAIAIGHLATRRGNRLGVVTFGGAESRRDSAPPGPRRPRRAAGRAAWRARGGGRRRRGHARRRAPPRGRTRAPAVARRGRLRLPRAARLAPAAARARRPARRRRRRDPRSARAGAPERRPALPRRSGDRPAAARRHEEPALARALRRRGCGRTRASWRARSRRSASVTSCSEPRATGCARS